MTKANAQFPFERPLLPAALVATSAVLLILLGIVLQLTMLGYGHFNPDSLWFVSVIAEGLWNVLAAELDISAAQQLLRLWPLLIVCSGLAILLSTRASVLARLTRDSKARRGDDA